MTSLFLTAYAESPSEYAEPSPDYAVVLSRVSITAYAEPPEYAEPSPDYAVEPSTSLSRSPATLRRTSQTMWRRRLPCDWATGSAFALVATHPIMHGVPLARGAKDLAPPQLVTVLYLTPAMRSH